jgi:phthalate 4,5-dioxygenase reductase subunit
VRGGGVRVGSAVVGGHRPAAAAPFAALPIVTDPDSLPLELVIARADDIADGVRRFELRDPAGAELPPFTAGSHIVVRVPNGEERKYSLCNDPGERDRYEIAVKRDTSGRGASVSFVDDAREGDRLRVSLPDNAFALDGKAPAAIFIAGGIGITPILAMIRALESRGDASWKLYYLVRDRASAPFADVLDDPALRARVRIHADGGDPARSLDLWPLFEKPGRAHVYCCGPRPLMDAVRDMTGHWPSGSVHFESFVDGAAMARPEDRPFTVRLARSGGEVEVPAGVTILEALRRAGHRHPSSCESGTCGTCKTRLVEGEPEHRDLVLAPDEQAGHIMICVSRARSGTLVLDL